MPEPRQVRPAQLLESHGPCEVTLELFAGSLVSVHLHHALAEDVKRVFFLLRPVSPQALSF